MHIDWDDPDIDFDKFPIEWREPDEDPDSEGAPARRSMFATLADHPTATGFDPLTADCRRGQVAEEAQAEVPSEFTKFLDTAQAATYLGVTERMVRRLADDGRLAVSKIGKYRRFTRENLDAAVQVVRARPPVDRAPSITSVPGDDPVALMIKRAVSDPPTRNWFGPDPRGG